MLQLPISQAHLRTDGTPFHLQTAEKNLPCSHNTRLNPTSFLFIFFFVLFLLLFLPANVAIRIIVWRPKKKCHLRCSERGGGGDLTWHIDTDTNMHSHPHAHTFRTWRHTHAPHTHTILPGAGTYTPRGAINLQTPDKMVRFPLGWRQQTDLVHAAAEQPTSLHAFAITCPVWLVSQNKQSEF